ncbi:hypothetical protein [[Mycoplasma] imitans]|nr:hypothetical protein [[Mycoplasma] imitans]
MKNKKEKNEVSNYKRNKMILAGTIIVIILVIIIISILSITVWQKR